MPTCGRCARRNKVDKCVYHPAPLTKTALPPTPRQTSSNHSSSDSGSASNFYSDRPGRRIATTFGSSAVPVKGSTLPQPLPSLAQVAEYNLTSASEAIIGSVYYRSSRANSVPVLAGELTQQITFGRQESSPKHPIRDDALSFDHRAAFINDFAVLTESELSIGIQPPIVGTLPTPSISQSHIDKGAAVLTLLRDFPAIQIYIEKWFSFASGFVVIGPMVKIYTNGIWSSWQKTLSAQKPADLRRMSERVWENTMRPISGLLNRHTTPQDFCANITGDFLRWEVVGIVVTLTSLLAQSLKGSFFRF